MRRLKLSMILLVAVSLFYSCSSDDDSSGDDTSGDLVGTWRMTNFEYNGESNTSIQGQTIVTSFEGVGTNIDFLFDIRESPNEYTGVGSYDIVLTTTLQGQPITQTTSINDIDSEGTWSRSGNILATDGEVFATTTLGTGIEGGMSSADFVIEELTATTLRLSNTTSDSTIQNGATVLFDVTSVAEFTRE